MKFLMLSLVSTSMLVESTFAFANKVWSTEPQGKERDRQYKIVAGLCQKKYSGQYAQYHLVPRWVNTTEKHGWFCGL